MRIAGWAGLAAAVIVVVSPGAAQAAAPGVPDGAPPVASVAERPLPTPPGWAFADGFPHTSGTHRLVPGALEWSDYVYDDHGAVGGAPNTGATGGSAGTGSYTYAAGPAHGNGADLWRIGVGLDAAASWWRVDWTTLADPTVPLAVWTFDTDANAATGVSAWPAAAGVSSAGMDRALVVSSRHTLLLDLVAGTSTDLGTPVADPASHSFLARVPRAALPVGGAWTVRLAGGLADAAGTAMAPVPGGSLPGQTRVFNVGFRTPAQEAPANNRGFDSAQAAALTQGDVSAFATTVHWGELGAGTATPEPMPTGVSTRWLLSMRSTGEGVIGNDPAVNLSAQDFLPNLLGRVQPYAVYVPTTYRADRPARLTWTLHELSGVYTQYTGGPAAYLDQLCEQRYSICVSPEGRGPDMYWYDDAELDLWEVWNRVGAAYSLDLEHTLVTGFSMGGWGSYRWPLAYPDLFAEAAPMDGLTSTKAFRFLLPGAVAPGSPEVYEQGQFTPHLEANGDQDALLENARWLRLFITHGLRDELAPSVQDVELAAKVAALGQRYRLQLHPLEGHTDWSLKGTYGAVVAHLEGAARAVDPGHVTFSWWPAMSHPEWGMAPTGAWWVKDPVASSRADGTLARIDARSLARPDPAVTLHTGTDVVASTDPSPGVGQEQTWVLGVRPAARNEVTLELTKVSSVRIDTARAGLQTDEPGAVRVTADRAATVLLDSRPFTVPIGASTITLPLTASSVAVAASGVGTSGPAHRSTRAVAVGTSLAATGTPALAGPALALAALGLWGRRRTRAA